MNIEEENILLQEKIDFFTKENDKLKYHIGSLQELLATNICKFFELSNSIKQTKKRFCYETVRECYGDLVYFYGCTDSIQDAEDYEECYKDIFGTEYTNDETDDDANNDTNNDTNNSNNKNQDEDIIGNTIETIFNFLCKDLIGNIEVNTEINTDLNVD